MIYSEQILYDLIRPMVEAAGCSPDHGDRLTKALVELFKQDRAAHKQDLQNKLTAIVREL